MSLLIRLRSVWRTLSGSRARDADLDEELRSCVEMLVERRVAAGEAPEFARRAVLRDFGGLEQVKERVREVRMGRLIDETFRDVAYALRTLRRSPMFAGAALATIALGVAANTAIFSVGYALLIQPLPFRDADRLAVIWTDQSREGYPRAPLSGPELLDLDQRAALFDGFGAIWATTAAITGTPEPEQLRVGLVSADFFTVLGAEAALGRTFQPGDEPWGASTTILLSGAVWQRRYGSDPGIVGRRIEVNGQPMTVIGVMPPGFRPMMPPDSSVPDDLEAWLPFNRRFVEGPRGQRYLRVVGRMRTGVSVADARADVARVAGEISAAHAFYGTAGRQFDLQPFQADSTRDVRTALVVLAAGVAILLLMACVNVGSVLVARAAARSREFAVKAALGAGRARLVRQHLAESLTLGALGAGLGVGLGYAGLRVLLALTPPALSRMQLASVNVPVVAMCVGTVLVWMTLLSLAPAREAFRARAAAALQGDRRSTPGRAHRRLRSALTLAQVSLSVVLMVFALLLVRTVQRVQQMHPGFAADGVLSFRLALPASRYQAQESFNAFSRSLQESLATLPGAGAAAVISHAPYDHVPNWGGPYLAAEGADRATAPQADYRAVSPGAMELLGVALLEGRFFTESDDQRSAAVAIVDERLAARTWPGQSAIGRRIGVDPNVGGAPTAWTTIVGVVRHVRHRHPVEEVRPQVYFPSRQVVRNPSVYLVKTSGEAAALAGAVRERLRALDAALPVYDVRPLSAYVDDARALREFTATLASIFAAMALLLAAVGVYGLMAYSVTERTRELAIRVALGARRHEVVRLVVSGFSMTMVAGVAAGLAMATAGAAWLRHELYGVAPWDPIAVGLTVSVLAMVATAAGLLPTRRAMRADPVVALRAE